MAHWLFKTEPDAFGIDDLVSRPEQSEFWDGVRNYQARNFLRDEVAVGDDVLLYHSSCKNVGIAGLATVVASASADPTQFDPESKYFDPKSSPDLPRWFGVKIRHVETFPEVLSLKRIKTMPGVVNLPLVKKGHRLSIMPVGDDEFDVLVAAARASDVD
ncbi:EVE domain-containing protein [Alteromonas sp. ASW11-36]|uniref:EVE domain-containing protein n=1 Tax=Alteromonas arenosi TaxID=3055817 RepID=A0ABT7SUD2_9ALTE|nr:EVE domain-containing protein [Alteromonas sp. ASW11-36]MDM7859786.1 EVE domain-containing protein [Alteromonas sp. ASW11-36]